MPSTPRCRGVVGFVIACVALALSPIGGAAAPGSAIQGSFSIYSVSTATSPVQLMAGTSGDVWFVTAASQLASIAATGAITLLGVTVPTAMCLRRWLRPTPTACGPMATPAMASSASCR